MAVEIHERRVAMCWEAGWEVVQQWEGEREGWLCLHNDTPAEDAEDVAAFRATGDIVDRSLQDDSQS